MPSETPTSEKYAILFLDVKHYSSLEQGQFYAFHRFVMDDIRERIEKNVTYYTDEYINTWGDGIVIVSRDIEGVIKAAVLIADYFNSHTYRKISWEKIKIMNEEDYNAEDNYRNSIAETNLNCRIAINYDYICIATIESDRLYRNTRSYFGKSIILTARIEPITSVGRIWVTESVSVSVKKIPNHYKFFPLGEKKLPKGEKSVKLWELGKEDSEPEKTKDDGLTKDSILRIKSLVGESFETYIGCDDAIGNICSFRISALSYIAELVRNTNAINETRQMLAELSLFSSNVSTLLIYYNGQSSKKTIEWENLRAYVIAMKNCILTMESNVGRYVRDFCKGDHSNREKIFDFFGHRLQIEDESNRDKYIKDLRQAFNAVDELIDKIGDAELNDVDYYVNIKKAISDLKCSKLDCISNTFELNLNKIIQKRACIATYSKEKHLHFQNLEKDEKLDQYLRKAYAKLPHNSDPKNVAALWIEGDKLDEVFQR